MSRTQRIRRRWAAILAALVAAATWAGGVPAAFAQPVPPGTGDGGRDVPPAPVHTATVGGLHGWQIILIAIGAVLAGAVLAVLYDRGRAARRGRLPAHATRA